jgi:hypothetical protein
MALCCSRAISIIVFLSEALLQAATTSNAIAGSKNLSFIINIFLEVKGKLYQVF